MFQFQTAIPSHLAADLFITLVSAPSFQFQTDLPTHFTAVLLPRPSANWQVLIPNGHPHPFIRGESQSPPAITARFSIPNGHPQPFTRVIGMWFAFTNMFQFQTDIPS